jgi:hypothetical protein
VALFQTVYDLEQESNTIRRRAYGVIEVADGKFQHIRLRPWPKLISTMEINLTAGLKTNRIEKDICRCYYNQPFFHSRFLTLMYIQSSLATTRNTLVTTLNVLDTVARIKQSNALLTEVTNQRVSDRAMIRWGWERHCLNSKHRHFIKRFYGTHPESWYASPERRAREGKAPPAPSSARVR